MDTMICPKCRGTLFKRRNYNPTLKIYEDGYTYTHIYDLSDVLSRKSKCYHTIKEG